MRILLIAILMVTGQAAISQTDHSIYVIETVQILNDNHDEAHYYYEENWQLLREIALDKGVIKSYKLLTSEDSVSDFDLMLITEFKDQMQFEKAETEFQKIILDVSPEGPKLLNEIPPSAFRKTHHSFRVKDYITE